MLSARARWAFALTLSFAASLALGYPARELDALRFDCDRVRDVGWSPLVLAIVIIAFGVACAVAIRAAIDGACDGRGALAFLATTFLPGAVAVAWPAFLSKDVVYYAVIGRSIARYGADPYVHVSQTMPHDDPYWLALPVAWRNGTSAYFPGFHAICRVVASIAGDDVRASMHIHQALALTCMLGAAWLAGDAVAFATRRDLEIVQPFLRQLRIDAIADIDRRASRARAVTMAFVALGPVTILEAASSAHNDAWLALVLAAGAALLVRDRAFFACAVVALGALIKPSGAMMAVVFAVAAVSAHVRSRRAVPVRVARRIAWLCAILAVAMAALALPWLRHMTESLEAAKPPMTSASSLEAIPRALLFSAGATSAEIALVFFVRSTGVAWLARIASGALEDGRALARVAIALFGFYIFFAGWTHAWYLLPVVVVAPFSDPRWLRAIAATLFIYPLTYVIIFSFACGYPSGWAVWTSAAIAQCALVVGTPLAFRLVDRGNDVRLGSENPRQDRPSQARG